MDEVIFEIQCNLPLVSYGQALLVRAARCFLSWFSSLLLCLEIAFLICSISNLSLICCVKASQFDEDVDYTDAHRYSLFTFQYVGQHEHTVLHRPEHADPLIPDLV